MVDNCLHNKSILILCLTDGFFIKLYYLIEVTTLYFDPVGQNESRTVRFCNEAEDNELVGNCIILWNKCFVFV